MERLISRYMHSQQCSLGYHESRVVIERIGVSYDFKTVDSEQ